MSFPPSGSGNPGKTIRNTGSPGQALQQAQDQKAGG